MATAVAAAGGRLATGLDMLLHRRSARWNSSPGAQHRGPRWPPRYPTASRPDNAPRRVQRKELVGAEVAAELGRGRPRSGARYGLTLLMIRSA